MDADLTLSEAATLMRPPLSEKQLRAFTRALRLPAVGYRHNGHKGRPVLTYDAGDLMRLHAALLPWLGHGE